MKFEILMIFTKSYLKTLMGSFKKENLQNSKLIKNIRQQ